MRSLFGAFLLIALVCTVPNAGAFERTNHITQHILTLVQTGYSVDTVVQLLIAMIESQKSNLARIVHDWEILDEALENNIANIQAIDDTQHAYCESLSATINDLETEIQRYRDFIHQAQDSIESSQESLAQKQDARCALSLVNTGKLKNSYDAIRLLEFLRASVADPGFKGYLGENDGAFMELAHHMKTNRKNSFGIVLKHHMLNVLFQNKLKDLYGGEISLDYDVQARTEAQIGHGHIDNDRSGAEVSHMTIDARNIDDFIADLLGYIDKLIEDVHHDIAETKAAEANSVQNLIDYMEQVEHDAIVLNRYIKLWAQHVEDLRTTRDQTESAWEECEARAEEIDESLEAAEEDYRERHNNYVHLRGMVQHTIDALEEILALYQAKVASAAEQYKARWDHELSEKAHERSRAEDDLAAREHQSIEDQIRRDHEAQQPAEPSTVPSASEPSTVYESTHVSAAHVPSVSTWEPSTETEVSASVVYSSSSSSEEEEEKPSNSNWVSAASESSSSSGWNEPAPAPVSVATVSVPTESESVSIPTESESTVESVATPVESESTVSAPIVSESTWVAPSESTWVAPSESTIAPVEPTVVPSLESSTVEESESTFVWESESETEPEPEWNPPTFSEQPMETPAPVQESFTPEPMPVESVHSEAPVSMPSAQPEPIIESESSESVPVWEPESEESSTEESEYPVIPSAPEPSVTVQPPVEAPAAIPAPTQENPQDWFATESSESEETEVAAPAAPIVAPTQENPQDWFAGDESSSTESEYVAPAPPVKAQAQANADDLFPADEETETESSSSSLGASAIAQVDLSEEKAEAQTGFLQRFWKAHH